MTVKTPYDFGATTLTGSSTAIRAALRSGDPIQFDPTEQWVIDIPITVPNTPVRVRDANLKWVAGTSGLSINQGSPVPVKLGGRFLSGHDAMTGSVLSISYTEAVAVANRDEPLVEFEGRTFIGVDPEGSVDTCTMGTALRLSNVNRPAFGQLWIKGQKVAQGAVDPLSIGIVATRTGTVDVTGYGLHGVHIRDVGTCFVGGQGMEGLQVMGGDYVNCLYGFDIDWSGGAQQVFNPHFSIIGAHINARLRGIRIKSAYEVFIQSCLFYRFQFIGGTEEWYGVETERCAQLHYTNNEFNGTDNAPLTPSFPMLFKGCHRGHILMNRGRNLSGPSQIRGDHAFPVTKETVLRFGGNIFGRDTDNRLHCVSPTDQSVAQVKRDTETRANIGPGIEISTMGF